MQPLNGAERQKAFFSFLLLFIVTIILIITVIFFSIDVTLTENQKLRQELAKLDNEREMIGPFKNEMNEIMKVLTGDDKRPPEVLDSWISDKIVRMDALIKNAPEENRALYTTIKEAFSYWKEDKKKIKRLISNQNQILQTNNTQ